MIDFEIINTPPRTSVPKRLYMRSNAAEGNLVINLDGGKSEYKIEQVQNIMKAIQEWLDDLIEWQCGDCLGVNHTTKDQHRWYSFDWVRCRHCKKKTKREKLGLT